MNSERVMSGVAPISSDPPAVRPAASPDPADPRLDPAQRTGGAMAAEIETLVRARYPLLQIIS